jgi:hypothetical protein
MTPSLRALAHGSAGLVIPFAFVPPSGERARPCGSRWSSLRKNDLDPQGLVCSACPGAKEGGMTRLPPQPPTRLGPSVSGHPGA